MHDEQRRGIAADYHEKQAKKRGRPRKDAADCVPDDGEEIWFEKNNGKIVKKTRLPNGNVFSIYYGIDGKAPLPKGAIVK